MLSPSRTTPNSTVYQYTCGQGEGGDWLSCAAGTCKCTCKQHTPYRLHGMWQARPRDHSGRGCVLSRGSVLPVPTRRSPRRAAGCCTGVGPHLDEVPYGLVVCAQGGLPYGLDEGGVAGVGQQRHVAWGAGGLRQCILRSTLTCCTRDQAVHVG